MAKAKILIVDDEIDYCMLMQGYFEDRNYEVFLAFTLAEGFNILKDIKPEIIFLDNNLPDGEGWMHAEEILELVPGISIHLISGYKQLSDFKVNQQKIRLWEKPLSVDRLNEVFDHALQ